MGGLLLFEWILNIFRTRKRTALLADAQAWPLAEARLLTAYVVRKRSLAVVGAGVQEAQVEAAFYFTVDGAYYGGHLRSVPMCDGEAHRALKLLPEASPVNVRYDPLNPDRVATLPSDNESFPVSVWPA